MAPGFTSLRAIKANSSVFNPTAIGVYRYVVAGHYAARYEPGHDPGQGCVIDVVPTTGRSELPGNDSVLLTRRVGEVAQNGIGHRPNSTHELGHGLGLDHGPPSTLPGGGTQECNTTFKSVMNYTYVLQGYFDGQGGHHYGYSIGSACGGAVTCQCDRKEWLEHNPPDISFDYIHLDCHRPATFDSVNHFCDN